jgi:hypothetical protein
VAYVEIALLLPVFIPLMLGTIGLGLNMHLQLQTVQLARDAGHMFAGGIVDFTQLGYQQVLVAIAGSLGLSTTAGKGNAVVILSEVRFVDVNVCKAAGKVDSHGNPLGCATYNSWVFARRIVVGNNNLRASNMGTPPASIVQSDGTIQVTDQATNTGDIATVTAINPWNSTNGTGVPVNQSVFVAEASGKGFHMPPFAGTNTYAQLYF